MITRAPSAELRPDQKDSDSLPPYEVLDPILEAFIEEDLSVDEIEARGFDRATIGTRAGPGEAQRIQAAAGSARGARQPPRVRARLALSDHQRLPALKRGGYQNRHQDFFTSASAVRTSPE